MWRVELPLWERSVQNMPTTKRQEWGLQFQEKIAAISVPLISLYALSSAQLDGTNSTDCAKPVLLKRTFVQRRETGVHTPVKLWEGN